MNDQIFSALIPSASAAVRAEVAETLARFPEGALRFAANAGVSIRILKPRERYDSASAELLKLGIDCDSWSSPPSGLFVCAERTCYLRKPESEMTVAHEFSHGLDLALGNGVYFSRVDASVRNCFSNARSFVTPYAASGSDEYFAECVRAFIGVNDEASAWPQVNPERLRSVDPTMFSIIEQIFQRFEEAA